MTDIPFSRLVGQRRQSLGLTQARLAELVGRSPSAVRSWERGRSQPTEEGVISSLAAVLGLDEGLLRRAAGLEPEARDRPSPAATLFEDIDESSEAAWDALSAQVTGRVLDRETVAEAPAEEEEEEHPEPELVVDLEAQVAPVGISRTEITASQRPAGEPPPDTGQPAPSAVGDGVLPTPAPEVGPFATPRPTAGAPAPVEEAELETPVAAATAPEAEPEPTPPVEPEPEAGPELEPGGEQQFEVQAEREPGAEVAPEEPIDRPVAEVAPEEPIDGSVIEEAPVLQPLPTPPPTPAHDRDAEPTRLVSEATERVAVLPPGQPSYLEDRQQMATYWVRTVLTVGLGLFLFIVFIWAMGQLGDSLAAVWELFKAGS